MDCRIYKLRLIFFLITFCTLMIKSFLFILYSVWSQSQKWSRLCTLNGLFKTRYCYFRVNDCAIQNLSSTTLVRTTTFVQSKKAWKIIQVRTCMSWPILILLNAMLEETQFCRMLNSCHPMPSLRPRQPMQKNYKFMRPMQPTQQFDARHPRILRNPRTHTTHET